MNNYTWEREPQRAIKTLEWRDLVLESNDDLCATDE